MALASVNNNPAINLSSSISFQTKHAFTSLPPSYLPLPRVPLSRSVVSFARRRNVGKPVSSKKKKSPSRSREGSKKEEDVDEDAFEALFKQLEEDLKKDEESLGDGDDEISEEELAMLERELEEALAEDEDLSELLSMAIDDATEGGENEEEAEDEVEEEEDEDIDEIIGEIDDEEEEEPIKLRGWQLRRLAYAVKVGRRKVSIKKLAAELCLDRAVVIELLRDPPPNLLMMSAALPYKKERSVTMESSEAPPPVPAEVNTDSIIVPDSEAMPSVPAEVITDSAKPEAKVETPIHVLHGSWSAQKRLKKVHVDTLERVYRRTKRPTNAMISSIVHVTNLPRKRVVKWFEDKRATDGEPDQRQPYQRSSSESVFAQ